MQSFEGIQAAAAGRYFTDGEFFALLVIDPETGELWVKALDPAQVNPALSMELPGGGMVIAGIEVDAGGKPVAVHAFKDWIPGLPLLRDFKITRVPIEDIVHVYDCEAAGQARGVSPLASVLLRLRELDALTDAQLVRQQIGALLAGFVTDADGTLLEGTQYDGYVASLEPGTMQRLKPGESVTFSDPPQTDAGAEAFQRGIVREIGAGVGIPSFMLDNDMGEVNFSSARVALIAFRRRLEQWQDSFAHQFLRPVYRRWLTIEILSGRIEAELNEQVLRAKFIAPKSVWVDPLKDSRSTVIALGAGLTSRREAVAALGLNVEELDAEIAADQAREKALGISFAPLPPMPPTGEEDEPPAGAPGGKANGNAHAQ